MTNTSKMKQYQVKATKADGEIYYIYGGTVWDDYNRAKSECDACNEAWPHIQYEVVEYAE